MAVSAAFARASEPADAVATAQSPEARPFAAGPGAGWRQAGGRAGVPRVPPSRVPVREGAADSGLRASQRWLLRECNCAQDLGAPSCDGCGERQLQRSGDGLRPSQIPVRGPLHPSITSAIDGSRNGGRPLERSTRERLELGLGESLGDVRVHADANAGALARALSARAFTVGRDLFFAAGAYQPGSRDGDNLIAHETTHAVQQRGAPTSGPLSVSAPGDAAELEAEAMASTLQAETSAHPHRESADAGGHEPTRTAGARVARLTPAPASAAPGSTATPGSAPGPVPAPASALAADGGAMVADGGPAPPVGKRTGRPIADLEREFRDLISYARSKGYSVAPGNLEHFLDGHGATRSVNLAWLRGFSEVTDAEDKNHGRFQDQLEKQAKLLADGTSATFSDHWDAVISAAQWKELFFASGDSELSSTGSFTLVRAGDTVTITGTVSQRWHDPYDWNPGSFAYIPGHGVVSDSVGLDLKDAGLGQDYLLEDLYQQTVTGTYTIRPWYLPNTSSFRWSGP